MNDTSQWWVLLRTFASLGAVIGLIYALSWAAKRFMKPEMFAQGAAKSLKVIYTMPIESKKRLMVVEVGSRQVLLGVAEGSISYLCEVPKDQQEARYVAPAH